MPRARSFCLLLVSGFRPSHGQTGSNPLGRRFLHGATSRILLSWAILFDAATLLSVFEPGEKNDDDIE